jgi:serralysin
MASDTLFLQPVQPSNYTPNFAEASGSALFFNYSQGASSSLTSVEIQALTQGGVAAAIANAEATFINDPAFTSLITETLGIGEDGAFEAKSTSKTRVIADFSVGANRSFSFNFAADLALNAKEIENSNVEYSYAASKTTFLVLDISDIGQPRVLDYFGIAGKLIPSKEEAALRVGFSRRITITSQGTVRDAGGDNDVDFLDADVTGTYQRTFRNATKIIIIELNGSSTQIAGDTLIDRLCTEVLYGTIRRDHLNGTSGADKIYASLENDRVFGRSGDDILEGGSGNDILNGNANHDKLHGGFNADTLHGDMGDDILVGGHGDDILLGGRGNDTISGSEGADKFLFNYHNHNTHNRELDIIQDFEGGIDKVEIQGLGSIDAASWFNQVVIQGNLIDTQEGASLMLGSNQKVLFTGLLVSNLSGADFTFV